MPVIALRRSAVAGLSAGRKLALRYIMTRLDMGTPAPFEEGGQQWLIWSDSRIDLQDVAALGVFAGNVADVPTDWSPPMIQDDEGNDLRVNRAQARQQVRNFVQARVTWPVDIPEDSDPCVAVLAAQGAPAAIRAGRSIPDGLTPEEGA